MDEIKIGEHVRTNDGRIFKIYKIDNKGSRYKLYSDEYTRPINYSIQNHSFNIEELLGKGDYVNGHQIVDEVYGEDDNDLYFEIEGGYNQAKCIKENEIETILTKEQYERDCYKIN